MIQQFKDWLASWRFVFEGVPALGWQAFAMFNLGFCLLGAVVLAEGKTTNSLDQKVSRLALEHPAGRGPYAAWLTKFGDGAYTEKLCLASAALVLLARRAYYVPALYFGVYGSLRVNGWLKGWFGHPRPEFPDWESIGGLGFPSGHSSAAATIYGFWILFVLTEIRSKGLKWGTIALLATVILIVGVTRITLMAHWLTDVLGGLCFGFAWVMAWFWVSRKLAGDLIRRETEFEFRGLSEKAATPGGK
ncbi:MAG TPA: phosphatase PAP2 family protein [Verrucomicrobiae bacterium]|nr:phosphatase PAP2 family protein [Verrucomicrobiae bacterium]